MITPYHWQEPSVQRTVELLSQGNLAVNTSETGTGKTVVALAAIKELGLRALVIAPKAVHTAWRRTAEAMGVVLKGVINMERLQYANQYYTKGRWNLADIDLVIVDEVHKGASGPKAKSTRIIGELKAYPVKVMPMSATIADSPLKLRAVGYLAGLHKFNNTSFYDWCLRNGCYTVPHIKGLQFPKGPRARAIMESLHQQMKDKMVRIRIAEVPEFPETLIAANLYDLDKEYTDQINEIYSTMEERLKQPGMNPMTEIIYARQRTELLKVPL